MKFQQQFTQPQPSKKIKLDKQKQKQQNKQKQQKSKQKQKNQLQAQLIAQTKPSIIKPTKQDLQKIYSKLLSSSKCLQQHPFSQLLKKHQSIKHPILPVLPTINQVFKPSQDKKKKPIQLYLDTINQLYKKRDLQILINPVYPQSVYEKWSPKQIAIFEEGILKFGKQFQFISELIKTKNAKDVFQFYNEWRFTSHYKQYKAYLIANNRSNLEDYV